jgi:hypothetical protein
MVSVSGFFIFTPKQKKAKRSNKNRFSGEPKGDSLFFAKKFTFFIMHCYAAFCVVIISFLRINFAKDITLWKQTGVQFGCISENTKLERTAKPPF